MNSLAQAQLVVMAEEASDQTQQMFAMSPSEQPRRMPQAAPSPQDDSTGATTAAQSSPQNDAEQVREQRAAMGKVVRRFKKMRDETYAYVRAYN